MKRSRVFHLSAFGCRAGTALLAMAFLSGLLAGMLLSAQTFEFFNGTRAGFSHPAGISALIPPVLPLLFSGFAIYAGQPLLLVPTAFWKALSFSYVATGVAVAWGSAGWLVSGVALFGSFCSLSVLWWYWLRHIGGEAFSMRTFLPAMGIALVIGWADLLVISPFLSNILIF